MVNTIKKMSKSFGILVTGDSMYPTFCNGECITVTPIGSYNLQVGEIIVYRKFEDHLTIHRIVEIKEVDSKICYLTKGDNNHEKDNYIVCENEVLAYYMKR